MSYGSGMTCWRRLRDWQAQGVWERLRLALLLQLRQHDQDRLEPSQYRWCQCRQLPGGEQTGPNPTDRGKLGSKRHIVMDRRGVALAVLVTGTNGHDSVVVKGVL